MKRTTKIVIALGVLLVGAYVARALSNPLRRSDAEVAASLLWEAPIGTSIDSVQKLITAKHWQFDGKWVRSDPTLAGADLGAEGSTILSVEIGFYQGVPWATVVRSNWGFDDSGHLVDVRVYRTIDSF